MRGSGSGDEPGVSMQARAAEARGDAGPAPSSRALLPGSTTAFFVRPTPWRPRQYSAALGARLRDGRRTESALHTAELADGGIPVPPEREAVRGSVGRGDRSGSRGPWLVVLLAACLRPTGAAVTQYEGLDALGATVSLALAPAALGSGALRAPLTSSGASSGAPYMVN